MPGIPGFDLPGDDGGPSYADGPGCFWHILLIGVGLLLVIGYLKWAG